MNSIIDHLFLQQIQAHQTSLSLGLSFLGGIISSISPCTLGLLPIIVGYVGGAKEESGKNIICQILFFVFGLSLALTGLGITSAVAGSALGSYSGPVYALVMAGLIMIMGLNLLEVIEIPTPVFIKEMPKNKNNSRILYPLVLGAAFAFATTPCSTPILAGIMAFASLKANMAQAAMMLFLFSLGQGLILILAAVFANFVKKLMHFRSFSVHLMKFSGIILILGSLFIYLKIFSIL